MSFPPNVKEDAMLSCGRHCCLCHKFCGLKIETHHIKPKAEGGDDTFENAIPLCFDCHADMRTYDVKHPKGTKYSEGELIRARNSWYDKVKNTGGVFSNTTVETDKMIYAQLQEILPWNGSLSFISANNFAGFSFRLDSLSQLYSFQSLCENPGFEFLDSDLESLKSELLNKINHFQRLIGTNTFPTSNIGRNTVPPEWEEKNYEHFKNVVDELHSSAAAVCETYQNLVRLCTRKLGILPKFM